MVIVQITDTHITLDGEQALHLQEIVDWINAAQPRPAAVLISGDAVNDGRREQYARLRDILQACAVDVYVVPGNHDRRPALRAALPPAWLPGVTGEPICYALDTRPVRIIALDTTDPGRPGGTLPAQRLAWLERELETEPGRPTLLFMHHPPFRTGVNLADVFGFKGLGAFRRIVERHRQVRRIIAGHVHCERAAQLGAALATTSISATPQFVPELFERRIAGLRAEPGGFALHRWSVGTFATTTYVRTGPARFSVRGSAAADRTGTPVSP